MQFQQYEWYVGVNHGTLESAVNNLLGTTQEDYR